MKKHRKEECTVQEFKVLNALHNTEQYTAILNIALGVHCAQMCALVKEWNKQHYRQVPRQHDFVESKRFTGDWSW